MTFALFGFHHGDENGDRDLRRRGIPDWRLDEAVRWAFMRGADVLLVERSETPPSSSSLVTHHVCSDARCPGGCE